MYTLQNHYTTEDVMCLVGILNDVLSVDSSFDGPIPQETVDQIFKDNPSIKTVILDLLGSYIFGLPKDSDARVLSMEKAIFTDSIDNMPLYINPNPDSYPFWMVIIARWRLKIGK